MAETREYHPRDCIHDDSRVCSLVQSRVKSIQLSMIILSLNNLIMRILSRLLLSHRPVSRPISACFSFSFFRTDSRFLCFQELFRSLIGRDPTYRPETNMT